MAHWQQHDPYYRQQPNYNTGGILPDPAPMQHYQAPTGGHPTDYDAQSAWDGKSTKSFRSDYGGSQAHLNPHGGGQYEMSQVTLPTVPFGQQANYPPAPQHQPAYGHQQQHYGHGQDSQYLRPGIVPRTSTGGYSAAREKMMRRRSVRHVELQQGNLVLDMPVPSNIVPSGSTAEEMTHLRYTAATCDPDDFMRSKYSLRSYLYGRQTELFIVMTMYALWRFRYNVFLTVY